MSHQLRRNHLAKTSRRDLLKVAGAGSLAAGLGMTDMPLPKSTKAKAGDKGGHKHDKVDGPLANATVSFGAWPTEPGDPPFAPIPIDRFPNIGAAQPPAGVPNVHQLIPFEATIKAGGSVNFIIAGYHHIAVYDDGTKPTDINKLLTVPAHAGPPLINDPNNRIYRGLDPLVFPQDRVEVVHFSNKGRYLVICAVLPHFEDDMYGYVKVV